MIETVLDNNNFQFKDKHYIQVDREAIGSKLEKKYACCCMREWDAKAMEYRKQPVFTKDSLKTYLEYGHMGGSS